MGTKINHKNKPEIRIPQDIGWFDFLDLTAAQSLGVGMEEYYAALNATSIERFVPILMGALSNNEATRQQAAKVFRMLPKAA